MKKNAWVSAMFLFLVSFSTMIAFQGIAGAADPATYEQTVARWTSYKDVADWMHKEFSYDQGKSKMVHGWQPQTPEQSFKSKSGICQDGALFAKDSLNRINRAYQAKIVFIKNKQGRPHHWVTSLRVDGKLYIIDYAAGSKWRSMMGVHGPYDSLDDYKRFLSSLAVPNFDCELVTETDK
jgi:hypothetical protein